MRRILLLSMVCWPERMILYLLGLAWCFEFLRLHTM